MSKKHYVVGLTPRQKIIIDEVERYYQKNNKPIRYKQLAKNIDVKQTTLSYSIGSLIRKKYMTRTSEGGKVYFKPTNIAKTVKQSMPKITHIPVEDGNQPEKITLCKDCFWSIVKMLNEKSIGKTQGLGDGSSR